MCYKAAPARSRFLRPAHSGSHMQGWQTQRTIGVDGLIPGQLAPAVIAPVEPAVAFDLTVLLPAYNEEDAIGRVLVEIVDALAHEPLRYEIVVVDDASTDRTAARAEEYAAASW